MKREEAIECIRGFMGQLTEGCREALMTAIPELRESEDEKHRKWILEYLYDGLRKADEQFKDHFKSAIDWLEKQEQKPDIEICPHSIKSKSYKENGYPIENCDYGLEIAYDILVKTFGEVRGYQTDDGIREHQTAIEAVRKAKEQNSAWSEKDALMLTVTIQTLERFGGQGTTGMQIDWLKSLPAKIK